MDTSSRSVISLSTGTNLQSALSGLATTHGMSNIDFITCWIALSRY